MMTTLRMFGGAGWIQGVAAVGVLAWLLAGGSSLALAQEAKAKVQAKHQHGEGHVPVEEMNRRFTDPKADVKSFVQRFEGKDRDIASKREEILRIVALQPGQAVADIGAGTGLFTLPFARAVGPTGVVYAVDISPAFLQHIAAQAGEQKLDGVVTPVLAGADSCHLPPGSVDVVFLCATYHHFGKPERNLASIHRALRPGGRLILIDFDQENAKSSWAREHARAPLGVYVSEFQKAGFERVAVANPPELTDNFYVEFRRVEPSSGSASGATP